MVILFLSYVQSADSETHLSFKSESKQSHKVEAG